MDEVCAGLPFTFVYIDDVLIASPDLETHLQHLRHVLQRFQQNGLVINHDKCEFGRSEIDFLSPFYRRLNNSTVRDRYPVANIQDLSTRLNGCNYYTKLDLVKGYYQVPMASEDIPKTAILLPFDCLSF